jgi:hypothetical protein
MEEVKERHDACSEEDDDEQWQVPALLHHCPL